MQAYSAAFKARVAQRLMGPRAVSANQWAATVGVSQETLSRNLSMILRHRVGRDY